MQDYSLRMTKNKFKLGVVTINLNNERGLRKTVESILVQDSDDFLYVVIDGGSNDGSLSFLETIQRNSFILVSEKDNGIYNAMNKGLSYVLNCNYVLFLNSGDSLHNSCTIGEIIYDCENVGADLFYGDAIKCKNGKNYLWKMPNELGYSFLVNNSICHSSTIYKTSTLKSLSAFDENYLIISDWKVLILFFIRLKKIQYMDRVLSIYDMEGVSTVNNELNQSERRAVLRYYKYHIKIISIIRRISNARF